MYKNKYNPSLGNNGRLVTFESLEWQIKIGMNTVSIHIAYRPPQSENNPYTGFTFVDECGDFLGDRLNNIDMLVGGLNFHAEDVKNSANVVFQDLLYSFGLKQHVDCPTHQSGHTLDLIITKEGKLLAYQTQWANLIFWCVKSTSFKDMCLCQCHMCTNYTSLHIWRQYTDSK